MTSHHTSRREFDMNTQVRPFPLLLSNRGGHCEDSTAMRLSCSKTGRLREWFGLPPRLLRISDCAGGAAGGLPFCSEIQAGALFFTVPALLLQLFCFTLAMQLSWFISRNRNRNRTPKYSIWISSAPPLQLIEYFQYLHFHRYPFPRR